MTTEVTSSGVTISTYNELVDQIAAELKSRLGAGIRADDPESVVGALTLPFSQIMAEFGEALQEIATSLSMSAGENSIADVGELNGVDRIPAVNSTVELTVTAKATAGCTIPAGSLVAANTTTSIVWATDEPITVIAGGSDTVMATCQTAGAIAADNGTLTTIKTPVYGWASVTNAADATVGNLQESIEDYRARQRTAARRRGSSSISTIYRALLDPLQGGANAAVILENTGSSTDDNGIEPGGIWAVVSGGDDEDVARALLDTCVAGQDLKGDESVNVYYDDIDRTLTAYFDRPEQIFVDIRVTVVSVASYFPPGGYATMRDAMIDYVNAKTIGDNLKSLELAQFVYNPAGLDVLSIEIREHGTVDWESGLYIEPLQKLQTQEGYITFEFVA